MITQAFEVHLALCQTLQNVELIPLQHDYWSYIWRNGRYSLGKFYKFLSQGFYVPQTFKWIWKSKCVMKHKVFIWLLIIDRLNTRSMLRRYIYNGTDIQCVLCNQNAEETAMHLFFECPFSRTCWTFHHINWQLSQGFHHMIQQAKQQFSQPFFMEIFITAT